MKMGGSSCEIPVQVNSLQAYVALKKAWSSFQCLFVVEMRVGVGLEGGLALTQPVSIWVALGKSLHSPESVLCVMRVLSLGLKGNYDVDFMPETGKQGEPLGNGD